MSDICPVEEQTLDRVLIVVYSTGPHLIDVAFFI